MANYILGLGGNCCTSCAADDPCKKKPIITACGSGTAYIGVAGTWAGYSSGSHLTGATWSMSAFTGLSINSSTGFVSGTVPTGPAGSYTFTVTATNACGSDSCTFNLTLSNPPCTFSGSSYALNGTNNATYGVSGQFAYDQVVNINIGIYTGTPRSGQFVVKANGSTIYDSGCITSTSLSTTVTVPAGTTSLELISTSPCDGGSYFSDMTGYLSC